MIPLNAARRACFTELYALLAGICMKAANQCSVVQHPRHAATSNQKSEKFATGVYTLMRHRNWMLFGAGVVLLACALFLLGCGSTHGNVRLVNGTLDNVAGLNLLVDNSSRASGVAYGAASPYVSVDTGSRNLQAETTGTTNVIASATASVASRAFYTFMTLSCSSCLAPITAPVVFTDNNSTPSAGNFNLRIINASPGLQAQDVYVVPPGTFTPGNPTFPNLAFGSASPTYSSLTAGTWEVDFTNPGQPTVNFTTTLTENALAVRTLVLLNAQAGGQEAPVLADMN
jgi:uncharacterized protein DUF4397